jgi:WD40 repeat protein
LPNARTHWDNRVFVKQEDEQIRVLDARTLDVLASLPIPGASPLPLHPIRPSFTAVVDGHSKKGGHVEPRVYYRVVLSDGGRRVAVRVDKADAMVWDWRTSKGPTRLLGTSNDELRMFSPDDRILVTAHWPERRGEAWDLRFWDGVTGRLLFTIPRKEPVKALAFSPDGLSVAVGGWRSSVTLWSLPPSSER